jgi:probable rRNA maturation factor
VALPFSFAHTDGVPTTRITGLVILKKKVAGLSEEALARFVSRARATAGLRGAVDVLVTTSTAMRSLNLRFRGHNKATDVLSFPAEPAVIGNGTRTGRAGEVAISAEIALQNAARLGHSPALEVKVLALHGILHLAGFDHERDNGEMARKEADLRRALRLPPTLIERCQPGKKKSVRARPAKFRLRRARRTA